MVQSLIEYLVKNLVDDPDQVTVCEVPGDDTVTLEVRVAQPDLGKVIGRQGRIANALRAVAKAAGTKDPRKVFVEIVA